jgi:EmrB/QacA subfamily drug resistance transporter
MAKKAVSPNLVLLVVSAGVFLSSLDLFIVNIAFPALTRDFADTSRASLSWVLNGYTIGFAALLAPAGRIADRFGRRRVFLLGLVVFGLASAGAGASWSVSSLIAFRIVQSTGAAMVMATSLALVLHAFPPARRPFAISVWSAIGAVAATCGPAVGGLLVQSSWRWIFLVNLPIGLAALLVGRRVLAESRDEQETRLPDLFGTALLIVGVAGITLALVREPGPDTPWVLAAGIVLCGATAARAARTPARLVPVLPLPLLRVRAFAMANLTALAFMTAFGATLLGNVLFLTDVWHLGTGHAGLLLIPGPALAAVFAVPGGRLGHRFGAGPTATVGTALYGLGCLWWHTQLGPTEQYLTHFLPGQILVGVGVGLTLTNLSAAVSSALPPGALATGSATLSASRQIGTVLGVALLLAVIGHPSTSDPMAPYRRGWLLTAGVIGLACLCAAGMGRARHPDLVPAAAPAVTPAASTAD